MIRLRIDCPIPFSSTNLRIPDEMPPGDSKYAPE